MAVGAVAVASSFFFFSPVSFFHTPNSVRSLHRLRGRHHRRLELRAKRFSKAERGRRSRRAVEEAFPGDELEEELYEFMQKSAKPSDFPTKAELLAAGRGDLAAAVAARGGWLAFGWDACCEEFGDGDGEGAHGSRQSAPTTSVGSPENPNREEERGARGNLTSGERKLAEKEDAGIDGILSRLEKERNLSFSLDSKRRGRQKSRKFTRSKRDSCFDTTFDARGGGSDDFLSLGISGMQDETSDGASPSKNPNSGSQRKWCYKRDSSSDTNSEAGEIIHPVDGELECGTSSPINGTEVLVRDRNQQHLEYPDRNKIHLRLQHLESNLSSSLNVLRSRVRNALTQTGECPLSDLHKVSDSWEFQETEVINARDELRSIRAKLAILEGKMALKVIEAQKIIEEKQRQIDANQKALCLLRTAYVMWPKPASEVLLAGSFDGWTTQRRMERSRTGMFSLQLMLYPGRYEIKFIVDGVWCVDPLRPIVNNNGYENNLLIVQ